MPHDEGVLAFGTYEAIVTYINPSDGYLRYRIISRIQETPEGTVTPEGFASLVNVSGSKLRSALSVGDSIRLLLFLKRGKDGVKRNYVAEVMQ